jgi:hypothetical protein
MVTIPIPSDMLDLIRAVAVGHERVAMPAPS